MKVHRFLHICYCNYHLQLLVLSFKYEIGTSFQAKFLMWHFSIPQILFGSISYMLIMMDIHELVKS